MKYLYTLIVVLVIAAGAFAVYRWLGNQADTTTQTPDQTALSANAQLDAAVPADSSSDFNSTDQDINQL